MPVPPDDYAAAFVAQQMRACKTFATGESSNYPPTCKEAIKG
jgi:hypothetical protein